MRWSNPRDRIYYLDLIQHVRQCHIYPGGQLIKMVIIDQCVNGIEFGTPPYIPLSDGYIPHATKQGRPCTNSLQRCKFWFLTHRYVMISLMDRTRRCSAPPHTPCISMDRCILYTFISFVHAIFPNEPADRLAGEHPLSLC